MIATRLQPVIAKHDLSDIRLNSVKNALHDTGKAGAVFTQTIRTP
jgi:hypothetical protein